MKCSGARSGFSLIEVLVAVTISGFLSVMVFQAISFFQKSALRYYEIAQYVRQQELWSAQLEKDLSSVVIPLFGFEQKKQQEPSKDPKAPKQPAPDKKEQEAFDKKRQEYAQKFVFECVIENSNDTAASRCKSGSWVTTHVLRVYDKQKPLLVRVRYYLEPSHDAPGLSTLYRQELPLIEMKDLEKTSNDARYAGVPIAYNIKQLHVAFTSLERKGRELQVKELSVWAPPKRDEKEKSVQQIPLPHLVSFTGMMVDPHTQHEYPFEVYIPLLVSPLGGKDEKSK